MYASKYCELSSQKSLAAPNTSMTVMTKTMLVLFIVERNWLAKSGSANTTACGKMTRRYI